MGVFEPVYIDSDIQTTVALQNGVAVGDGGTPADVTYNSGTRVATPLVIHGGWARLSSAGGTVVLEAYESAARVRQLFRVSIDFTDDADMGWQFSAPIDSDNTGNIWWEATGDATSATKTMQLRFTIQKIHVGAGS